jgi:hypothetical protein
MQVVHWHWNIGIDIIETIRPTIGIETMPTSYGVENFE